MTGGDGFIVPLGSGPWAHCPRHSLAVLFEVMISVGLVSTEYMGIKN
jgi:hypothetical protein